MASKRVKDQVRDGVEQQIDALHKVADVVTFPLAPIDGAIHGVARGLLNWVTDNHPDDRDNRKPKKTPSSPPPCKNVYYPAPPPPPHYGTHPLPPQYHGYLSHAPPPPPHYYPPPPPAPPSHGYPYHHPQGVYSCPR